MDQKLRPIERLQTSLEYRRVFNRGRRYSSPAMRVHYAPSGREFSRLGLVVSRKVGKACIRNRVKRLLREVYRRAKGRLPRTMDLVIIPQRSPLGYQAYLDSFNLFLRFLAGTGRGERRERGADPRRAKPATRRRRAPRKSR